MHYNSWPTLSFVIKGLGAAFAFDTREINAREYAIAVLNYRDKR